MKNKRIVVDSNVFISGILFPGRVRLVLDSIIANNTIYCSEELIEEVKRILITKFQVTDEILSKFLELIDLTHKIQVHATVMESRDPNDDFILALAEECEADFIVTGDKDLLTIKAWRSTKIISPSEYK